MSLNFEIVEPGKGASQLAYKTRAALSQFIHEAQPLLQGPALAELSKESVRSFKDQGAAAFNQMLSAENDIPGTLPLAKPLRAFAKAWNSSIAGDHYRTLSYTFEGMVRAMNAHLHSAGIKLDTRSQVVLMATFNREHTSGGWDTIRTELTGLGQWEGISIWNRCWVNMNQYELADTWVQKTSPNSYSADRDPALFQGMRQQFSQWFEEMLPPTWGGDTYPRGAINGPWSVPIVYDDVDGPWVAGLLTPQDCIRLRFTRVRLGSWLSTIGLDDDTVRTTVEQIKANNTSGGTFKVYPNDVLFGAVYEAMAREGKGVSSCMAAPANEYDTWDGIHPTDVYSSAHFGSDDNGLALFTYMVGGVRIGRGIVNTESMACVRWYGSVHGERALRRVGIQHNSCALKGSWLALVQDGNRMIAPYLDGDVEYVKDEGDRLLITNDGGMYASETSGVIGVNEVYCCDDEEYHDQDDCTFQSESNTWISEYCDDWRCPVIGEYCPAGARSTIYLDGEEVEVHERVTDRINSYLTQIDPTEDMLDEHGEWDDTEEGCELVDDSDVPYNYTGKGPWATVAQPMRSLSIQTFSRGEAPVARAAAPVPATGLSIPAQTGCDCILCRRERGEV
jgi:hypothetical protein